MDLSELGGRAIADRVLSYQANKLVEVLKDPDNSSAIVHAIAGLLIAAENRFGESEFQRAIFMARESIGDGAKNIFGLQDFLLTVLSHSDRIQH